MAHNFGVIADNIDTVFPATMYIDWIRVYQSKDSINVGCDPPDFPTATYINTYVFLYCFTQKLTFSDTLDFKMLI